MQFQADITAAEILLPNLEELSAFGAVYVAGMALNLYDENHVSTGYPVSSLSATTGAGGPATPIRWLAASGHHRESKFFIKKLNVF